MATLKRIAMSSAPKILVFDSGLGGLTVHAELVKARPDASFIYAADDSAFPIGEWPGRQLTVRMAGVMAALIAATTPDIVVIACNTASTLALPVFRAAHPQTPFVGTVPAIKPAALASRSKLISVLATPGTVARDYTQSLIREFSGDCSVNLVGSARLASLAEDQLKGGMPDDAAIAQEIMPCFIDDHGRRTDHVVLACTHYPLLGETLERLSPWRVDWVDPAPAIARRADHLLTEQGFPRHRHSDHHKIETGQALFSSGAAPNPALARALAKRHLEFAVWSGPPLDSCTEGRDAAQ